VCLGASTTEGSQSDQETYPYYLNRELEQLFPTQKIEVVNAGHHAQDAESLLWMLRHRVLPLHPDVIIFYEAANNHFAAWDFVKDIPCDLGDCWLTQYPRWYQGLYHRSALFVLLTNALGLNNRRPPPMPHRFDLSVPNRKFTQHVDTVRQIVREARDSGAQVVLGSFITVAQAGLDVSPSENKLLFDDIYKKWYPLTPDEYGRVYDRFNQEYAGIARELHITFADVAAKFPKDPRLFPFDYYHLSPEGNQQLAHLLAQDLASQVLPRLNQARDVKAQGWECPNYELVSTRAADYIARSWTRRASSR
jgi:lysophospholipase L1-like esterase